MTGPQVPPFDERAFRAWYEAWANKAGIDPDPDNPLHKYDYRGAYRAGAEPQIDKGDGLYHWPSEFKADDHPNRFVKGVGDTKNLDKAQSVDSVFNEWIREIQARPDATRVAPRRPKQGAR